MIILDKAFKRYVLDSQMSQVEDILSIVLYQDY